eukprot:GHVU01082192.1.p1 GENE.GHVU01082192.1~~GHVU01082192.1.p1  ORF type:complete len:178 (-),score=6.85 GHVU01082192.1:368-901(-)
MDGVGRASLSHPSSSFTSWSSSSLHLLSHHPPPLYDSTSTGCVRIEDLGGPSFSCSFSTVLIVSRDRVTLTPPAGACSPDMPSTLPPSVRLEATERGVSQQPFEPTSSRRSADVFRLGCAAPQWGLVVVLLRCSRPWRGKMGFAARRPTFHRFKEQSKSARRGTLHIQRLLRPLHED